MMRLRINRLELSGGLADIGVLLPIMAAMVAINHVNPFIAPLLCGLFYIATSLYYQVPVPVQPLKVFCTVAIAIKASPDLISAGTLLIGVIFLVISIPRVMIFIKKLFPLPIIRGIQLGTGLLLIDSGIKIFISSQVITGGPTETISLLNFTFPTALFLGIVCTVILLYFLQNPKYPVGLVLIVIGIGISIAFGAEIPNSLIKLEPIIFIDTIGRLQMDTILQALWLLVLPQVPLSVGNAVVATENTLKIYFKEQANKVKASRLSLGMGCFNVLSGLLGGIPCCHGCGGVTAHYRLGARTGTATLLTGTLYILLAMAVYFLGASIFKFFPYPILGALLIYVGLEHGLLIRDMTTRLDLAIVLIIASIAFTTRNMTIAFMAGMIVRKIAISKKIFA